MSRLLLPLVGLVLLHPAGRAEEPSTDKGAAALSVEKLAEKLRPSVVVVTVQGRDGKREGLGTGFVLSGDGLIATNLHVIGEGRAITVETADGKKYDVTEVHASDRRLDLAVVKIAAKGLTPLRLGDSTTLKTGQAVLAMGNPQGLKHSVVSGVVSGLREIDGRALIQLAMPIEPGNSGGPLVDMQGRVHGLLTIKSLVTDNLGFAVAINALKPLLAKPNPVPMSAWLTIGALDADEWEPLMGAHWSQRAGRIKVEGPGEGFGGRSLCLSRRPMPPLPFEIAVSVRLDDESGAAGLAFHSDGGDRHYGFYPTGGKLRLTRFDGPDVFSWKILEDKASPHYRPGAWNTLKVRLEKGRILCFVNDKLVMESKDDGLTEGRLGLAKFRDTKAEFKHFRTGKQLAPAPPPADAAERLGKLIETLPREGKPKSEDVGRLAREGPAGPALLRERARALEEQAARMRHLAAAVEQRAVLDELTRATAGKDESIDLVRAALLLARLDNADVDVDAYRAEVERMAGKVKGGLAKDATETDKIEALNRYFFKERGFHGSRADYYNRSNSYLSEVIDDREGLPITLSVLYMELARRLGLKVEGVGLPGHFVVRHVPAKGRPRLIDVYEGGEVLTRDEAARKAEAITGRPLQEEQLAAVGNKAIVVRMLHNLLNVADREKDSAAILRYLDAIVAVDADAAEARALRAGVLFQHGDRQGALKDVDWLLEHEPEGLDLDRVRQMRRILTRPEN
jgi:S1-C subfamily serine protease/regulator of sirC expression with transglutaminase-like and TPR domain